jgi:DNA-binding PadR family transcriptional regulator
VECEHHDRCGQDDHRARTPASQEGCIASEWGTSENGRKAKYYRLTRAGRRQLAKETRQWEQTSAILAQFLSPDEASS